HGTTTKRDDTTTNKDDDDKEAVCDQAAAAVGPTAVDTVGTPAHSSSPEAATTGCPLDTQDAVRNAGLPDASMTEPGASGPCKRSANRCPSMYNRKRLATPASGLSLILISSGLGTPDEQSCDCFSLSQVPPAIVYQVALSGHVLGGLVKTLDCEIRVGEICFLRSCMPSSA
ncbi:unnamed protein product, partial [Dibothriocephalus latus]